jgi:hypothetical protein
VKLDYWIWPGRGFPAGIIAESPMHHVANVVDLGVLPAGPHQGQLLLTCPGQQFADQTVLAAEQVQKHPRAGACGVPKTAYMGLACGFSCDGS